MRRRALLQRRKPSAFEFMETISNLAREPSCLKAMGVLHSSVLHRELLSQEGGFISSSSSPYAPCSFSANGANDRRSS